MSVNRALGQEASLTIWAYSSSERLGETPIVRLMKKHLDADTRRDGKIFSCDDIAETTYRIGIKCPYCRKPTASHMRQTPSLFTHYYNKQGFEILSLCMGCGWWSSAKAERVPESGLGFAMPGYSDLKFCQSVLKELHLADLSVPIAEVGAYLRADYEARFALHPRQYEALVTSIFANIGYQAELTNYRSDGGIDVILRGDAGRPIGVQVKRYRERIGVAQIREFLGALVLGGFTQGVFVTTSEFTFGAKRAAELASDKKVVVKLVGNNAFLELMDLKRQAPYESFEEWDSQHSERTYQTLGQFLGALYQ